MSTVLNLEAVKERQRLGWQTGDYPRIGVTLQIIAELLVEAADVRAGESVLDVACGQGNAAIAAARRFAEATGVDYAPNLLAQARERARAEGLSCVFVEGDAERLPFPDAAFDLVLSTVGVMFAPDHQRAASDLVRVTKPGGRIALSSWTPASLPAQLFGLVGRYAPPPPGVPPASGWGTEQYLGELFGGRVEWASFQVRQFWFRYRSPEHWASYFIEHYGPITRLAGSLDAPARAAFERDLTGLAQRFNTATDGTMVAPGDYLDAVGKRS
jgi:SAM-dependent methyltransferase